jgi:hypothetical protein
MLKISENLREFYLHDGTIYSVQYSTTDKRLTFEVKLTEESEVGWFGKFIFNRVRLLELDPPPQELDWDTIDWANISTADYIPNDNQNDLEACLWVASVYYKNGQYGNIYLKFLAEGFEWHPDLTRGSPYTK